MLFVRLLLVAFLLFGGRAYADRLDDLVQAEMERTHVPGLAVAVLKNGTPVRLQGWGFANLEHRVPVSPRTVFKLASLSKHMIAATMLLLSDEGKLSLDDPVRRHLEDAPPTWEGITLRQLLSHTGGLARESPAFDGFRMKPDADVVRAAYALPLIGRPGEKWQYSNVGYFAAAEIVRRVSGKAWEELAAERLFRPVGMIDTRVTSTATVILNRADGYDWQNGEYRNATNYIAVRPSGAFLSTLEDMVRWDAALGTNVPLKARLRDQMWTAVPLNDGRPSGYGLGWNIGERQGRRVFHHGGSLPGFRSYYARFPAEHISVIVLANGSGADSAELTWKIAAEFIPGFH